MIDDVFEVTGAPFASIAIRIGPPEPCDGPHGCLYELVAGTYAEGPRRIYGEGPLQALLLTLSFVATRIEGALRASGGRIDNDPRWEQLRQLGLRTE